MRVITGKYKGRKLAAPSGHEIRPTSDKVKEAMFSILTDRIYGSRVLDLFAGTGSIGIEALSRGAEYCVFGDNSGESLRLVKENLAHCKVEEKTRVVPGDFKKVLKNLEGKFDIIILDPPYNGGMMPDAFRLIEEFQLLDDEGVIVAEHRKEEILPDETGGFIKIKERKYGIVVLSIYAKI
ncbi:MAG: 16S rRNA (guanine(966)-N(2))-methyltransferase RsmD [Firmicutes bacterium]|nr:16S rRNA (guanine(966)-N(2))-methyltransferase RsmD [Bacillota bacterium]